MKINEKKLTGIILISLAVISVLWICFLSLTPIIDRDATRFHLPFAKLWAENGFMYFRKYFAYYDLNMLNLNYLYMLVFRFDLPDQLTKIIHASFLIAGASVIFSYFFKKYGFNWAALSFVMYITIPIHQRLASEVYVDLGLLFFATVATVYFLKWYESEFVSSKYFIISAVGAGLSFGTKYNGMIIAFFLTMFSGFLVANRTKNDILALKKMALYSIIVISLASPWLIRNYLNSNNPFFPLFSSVFESSVEMPEALVKNVEGETANRIVKGGENFISLAMLPLRVFFQGKDHDFLRFDGVLNPFMLILLIFIFIPEIKDEKKRIYLKTLFVFFCAVYLITLYSNDIRIRYFIALFPLLIILNIESLKNLDSVKKFKPGVYIFTSLFLLFNYYYSYNLYGALHLDEFSPFSSESKELYLENNLENYSIFRYINQNTPPESVIYESMTGGRGYYIDRIFYCDTSPIDRHLLNLVRKGAAKRDFENHFNNLPNSDLKATHFIFRPKSFIHSFFNIDYDEEDPEKIENTKKIKGLIEFLDSLKILKEHNGTYLFELNTTS